MTFEEIIKAVSKEGFKGIGNYRTLSVDGGKFVIAFGNCDNINTSYLYVYTMHMGATSEYAVYSATIEESDVNEFATKLNHLISWLKPELEGFHKRMTERLDMFKNNGHIKDWI